MNRLVARRRRGEGRGEEGASLIIAMAFIVLFALLLTALLSFATTSFQSQATIQQNTKAAAAAAAAVDTAVAKVRNDPAMLVGGDPAAGGSCGGTLLTYHPTNGAPDVSVNCAPVVGSDAVQPGVGGPANALLTLGAGGITANNAGVVKTTGSVFSNTGITLNNGSVLDATDNAITAKGACGTSQPNADPKASISPWLAVNTQCNALGTSPQINDANDPRATDARYNSRLSDVPQAFNPAPTCTGRTLTFAPGRYTDVSWFSTAKWPLVVCGAGTLANVLYFSPGAYYFDFGANGEVAGNTWNLTNVTVVGGKRSAAYTGNAAPSFPANMQDNAPVNCQLDAGAGAATGLQFILGGASQMVIGSNSKTELCPKIDAKGFGIAVVGLNSGDPGVGGSTPGSLRLVPSTAVAPAGDPATSQAPCTPGTIGANELPMSNVTAPTTFPAAVVAPSAAGTPIDGKTAFAGGPKTPPTPPNPPPIAVGGSGSVMLCGFDWGNTVTVPPGSTITGVSLDIAHYELPCPAGNQQDSGGQQGNGTCTAAVSFSDGTPGQPGFETQDSPQGLADCDGDDPCVNGSFTATVSSSAGTCTATVANRLALGTDPLAACIGSLVNSGTPIDAAFAQSLRITYQVKVNGLPVAQAFLDGIVMHLDYDTPATHAGNGCVVALTCAAFKTSNGGLSAPVFANWGTSYFPNAWADLNFSGTTKIAFDRGLIASQVTLNGLPAADPKGRFRLSTGSGRTFDLTAQSGNQKVSARIRVVDSATASPHGFAVAVREWSTAS